MRGEQNHENYKIHENLLFSNRPVQVIGIALPDYYSPRRWERDKTNPHPGEHDRTYWKLALLSCATNLLKKL